MQSADARYDRLLTKDEVGIGALAQARQIVTGFGSAIYEGSTGNSDAVDGMVADCSASKTKVDQALAPARVSLPGQAGDIDAVKADLATVESAIDKVTEISGGSGRAPCGGLHCVTLRRPIPGVRCACPGMTAGSEATTRPPHPCQ